MPVFEKSEKVKCIPVQFDWSDLGGFEALYKEFQADNENTAHNVNQIAINSAGNFIYLAPENKKVIATVDVNDLIIADTGDALLVAPLKSSQK